LIEDTTLGPAVPELGWVPAPRYLMRRARILRLLERMTPGRLLEVGPGAGMLLLEAARRGFSVHALEASDEARELMKSIFAQDHRNVVTRSEPEPSWAGQFDTLFAFDVLEHIENDGDALRQWHKWLVPEGTLLLSVPAHAQLWSAGDVWAGHWRRYERAPLMALLEANGFAIEHFECYGYPLTNLSERLSRQIYARRLEERGAEKGSREHNNDRSGIDRGPLVRLYPMMRSVLGKSALATACLVQNLFVGTDMGSGYLVKARRK